MNKPVETSCPECGAHVQPTASQCWLCGSRLEKIVPAVLVPTAPERSPYSFSLMTLFIVVTLVALTAGLAVIAPGLAVLLVVIAVPALIGASIRTHRMQAAGRQVTWSDRIVGAITGTAVTLGALYFIVLAGVAALFLICAYSFPR